MIDSTKPHICILVTLTLAAGVKTNFLFQLALKVLNGFELNVECSADFAGLICLICIDFNLVRPTYKRQILYPFDKKTNKQTNKLTKLARVQTLSD